MEVEEDAIGWEKTQRVRVLIDVNKPLHRFQKIKNRRGNITTVTFKYERPPTFYSHVKFWDMLVEIVLIP
ncbi:GTPase Obg [Bienertia sinuspersici]